MLRLFLLFSFLVISLSAKAATANLDRFSNMYKLMSYEELMSLSKEDRKAYVESAQQMFVQLEMMGNKRAPASFLDIFEDQSEVEQIDFASYLPGMPSLSSDGKVVCRGKMPGSSQILVPYRVSTSPDSGQLADSYVRQVNPLNIPVQVPGVSTAIALKAWFARLVGINPPTKQNPKDFICRAIMAETIDGSCEKGFVPGQAKWRKTLPNGQRQDFVYMCFSETSFKTLSSTKQTYMQRYLGDVIARQELVNRPRNLRTTPPPRPDLKAARRSRSAHTARAQVEHQSTSHLESEFDSEFVAKEPPAETATSFCEGHNDQIEEFPRSPDPKTCNDQSIASFREKFYRGPDNLCVYGGNLSQYANGEKKAGGCSPHSQFCVESLDCKNPATGDRWKPTFQCASNQIICNPLLFGIQSDGKTPFCVSRGPYATAHCEAASENSDQGSWENITGMRDAWNMFAQSFNKLCAANSDGANFFCRECHSMKRRLYYMNARAKNLTRCQQTVDGAQSSRVSSGKTNSGVR